MDANRHRPSYLSGLLTLIGLAVLTWIEFQVNGELIALLVAIGIAKAAVIAYFFMHIARLWSTEP